MVAGIYYSVNTPKIYEASTLILIEPQRVPENYVQSIVENDPSARIQTISEQVNSRTNLERIIHDFNLFSEPEHENMFMEDKLESMRQRISVDVTRVGGRRGSDISSFTISYRGKDPDKTMKIADTLATYLISENLRTRESQAQSTSDFLDEELTTMRGRLVEVEGNLKNYRKKHMGELPEQLEANLAILERLQEQLSDRRQNLREERNQLAVVEQLIASPPAPSQIQGQAPLAVGESSDLEVLKEQLAVLTAKYTERHPDVIRIKKMIADLESQSPKEPGAVDSYAASRGPAVSARSSIRDENYRRREEIRLNINGLETEISELEGQIAFYRNRVESTPRREQELASLQRDYENIQTAYNSLLERKLEADIAVNMEKKQQGEQFQILDPASLPQRPVEPDMRKVFLLFLAAGLGFSVGITYMLEYLDTSFRKPEDVESLHITLLATIPVIEEWKDRLLKKTNHVVGAVTFLVSIFLFVVFFSIAFRGEDTMPYIINFFKQV
jgi:polysaccharide chain length determinant protein (PEP-CTERM system associated)